MGIKVDKMIKGYKCRLYPNKEQSRQMNQTFGNVRYVYNYFLNERKRAYIEEKKTLSLYETQKMMAILKKDADYTWLNNTDSMALQESLKDLDRAYINFFKTKNNFPKYHSKKSKQSYRIRKTLLFVIGIAQIVELTTIVI